MTSTTNNVVYGRRSAEDAERTRYLVDIQKLTTATVKVKIIHNMMKNLFDLKPYDKTVTLRIAKDVYDSVLMAFMEGKPTVIEILNGKVLAALDPEEAEVMPLVKVSLQAEETSDAYATIYVSKENAEKIAARIKAMNFHWNHESNGVRHVMSMADAIEVDANHCRYCAAIKLKKTATCKQCASKGVNPDYDVAYELLGMVKITAGSISTGGEFSVKAETGGQKLVIQCKGFVVNTNIDELQSIFEEMVSGPGQDSWNNTISR